MTTLATIEITKDYGFVLLAAAATHLLSNWLGTRIGPFRHAAGIPHPSVAATPETIAAATSQAQKRAMYLFNCAQRAHHNFLENYAAALSGMLISGLAYPRVAAVAGVAWMVGRVIYAVGYTSASERNVDGKGRWSGGGFYVAAASQVGFMVLVGKMGWDLLWA